MCCCLYIQQEESSPSNNTILYSTDFFVRYTLTLSEALILKAGEFPTVKVAFGTSSALAAAGNMAAGGTACATGSATVALYGAEPDVTVSFE